MSDYPEQLFDLLDRPIAFHRGLKRVINSANTALMLSQAIYWSRRTEDGWFYKTQAEWEEETFLTRREQETARKYLRTQPFWDEEKRGLPAKLYFRVNFQALFKALAKTKTLENSSMAENANLERRKTPNTNGGKRQPCEAENANLTIYTKNTYKELDIDKSDREEFSDFKNLWNSEKAGTWAACEILSQGRINLVKKLIKAGGSYSAALEILEKACKYARNDKFWAEKRMTIDNILRHALELSERYLETPNGHVINAQDIEMAARQQKSQELAERLAKKFNYNGVNDNA